MTTAEVRELVGEAVSRETAKAIRDTEDVSGMAIRQLADPDTVLIESVSFYPVPMTGPTYITSTP